MPGLGLSIPESAARSRSDPDVRALIGRMAAAPDPGRALAIGRLVGALKAADIWPRLHALYLLAAHDAQAAGLNWVADSHGMTPVGGPGFTADRGYLTAHLKYLDTGFAPSALASRDDCCFALWSLTPDHTGGDGSGIYEAGGGIQLKTRDAEGRFGGRINQIGAVTSEAGAVTDGRGLFALNRSSATQVQGYRNGGVLIDASSSPSAPAVSGTIRLGYLGPYYPSYSPIEVAGCVIADGLDADRQLALYSAMAAYLTALGAA